MKKIKKFLLLTPIVILPTTLVVGCYPSAPEVQNDRVIPMEIVQNVGAKVSADFKNWFLINFGDNENPIITYTDYERFLTYGEPGTGIRSYTWIFENKIKEFFEIRRKEFLGNVDYGSNTLNLDISEEGLDDEVIPIATDGEELTLKSSFIIDDSIISVGTKDIGAMSFVVWAQGLKFKGKVDVSFNFRNDWLVKKTYKQLWDDNFLFNEGKKIFENIVSTYDKKEVFIFNEFQSTFKETTFTNADEELERFLIKMEDWIGDFWWDTIRSWKFIIEIREMTSWVFTEMMQNFEGLVTAKDSTISESNYSWYNFYQFHPEETDDPDIQRFCEKCDNDVRDLPGDKYVYCDQFTKLRDSITNLTSFEQKLELEVVVSDKNKGILPEDVQENFKIYLGTFKFESTEVNGETNWTMNYYL